MHLRLYLIFPLILIAFTFNNSWAWDDQSTHRDLSKIAAQKSILNAQNGDYLKNLGYTKGDEEIFALFGLPKKVWDWVEEGSEEEDAGNFLNGRYYNHFHDPTKAWDQAGLSTIYPGVNGKSSVLWAQDVSNDWSWQKVRDYYSLALTSQTVTDRNTNFANTFKGLGHIIHLIQDTSQPAHVRNDPHGLEALGLVEGFESWAVTNRSQVSSLMSNSIPPTFSLNDALITQFFDTDQYNGANPSNSTALGLTEYTNANFFSEDTIFSFSYPAWSSMEEYEEEDQSIGEARTYLRKTGDGESIEHLATAGLFYDYLPTSYKSWSLELDDQCYSYYAEKLIPRAVGYSAGLLNYFFRGEMDMKEDPDNLGQFIIENKSGEIMSGTFTLYYDYEEGTDIKRKVVTSWDLSEENGKAISGNGKEPMGSDIYILIKDMEEKMVSV